MALKHVGTFQNPYPGTDFWDLPKGEPVTDDMYDRWDEFTKLKVQADLMKGTFPDGKVQWLAEMNFNGGQCDCCRGVNPSDFKTIEFYKEGE